MINDINLKYLSRREGRVEQDGMPNGRKLFEAFHWHSQKDCNVYPDCSGIRTRSQTAGEVPRYDIENDHTPMKIALWNVNGAASKEEEINVMMRGTNASCGIITETWLRPGQTLNCP